jgi:hypothetical protein
MLAFHSLRTSFVVSCLALAVSFVVPGQALANSGAHAAPRSHSSRSHVVRRAHRRVSKVERRAERRIRLQRRAVNLHRKGRRGVPVSTTNPTTTTTTTHTSATASPGSVLGIPTSPTSGSSGPPSAVANSFGADEAGIAAGGSLQNEDSATLAQDLNLDKSSGAKWLRIDINWSQIQNGGPNSYDWTNIDNVVQGAEARGMSVLGIIVYTPSWARPAGTDATYGPAPATYAQFASAAVAHYSAMGVNAYEVWNEENNQQFWTPSPNIASYTAMLRAAYPAIKAADPNATVVSGGLSPETNDGTDIAPVTFLQGIYADGGQGSFDAVGVHPYCNPDLPGTPDGWSTWYQIYGTSPSIRSIMVANGDAAKKVWGTEFGAPSSGAAGVSPAFQAQTVTTAFQLWSTYSWAGPLFFYQGRDEGSDATDAYDNYGFATDQLVLKPAFSAFQQAVQGF